VEKLVEATIEETPLLGLRISAGLLVALGCLWGFYAIFSAVILGLAGVRAWKGNVYSPGNLRLFATLLLTVIILTALAWISFRAAAALRDGSRWGGYVAMAFGLLLLLFTGGFVYDIYHPERQGPDDYFGILIVPFTLVVGLWWCIYLNLPHVRAYLRRSPSVP
jgi:hypothetical protein